MTTTGFEPHNTIEGELADAPRYQITPTGIELVPVPPARSAFGTDNPVAIMQMITSVAKPLADFIKDRGMSKVINRREYVFIEGWSLMGALLGIAPITREVREIRSPEDGALLGFEARVELVTRDGSVVGGGIGECSWVEANWSDRDPFAVKSMAQTRATGKAYRLAFGFVMKAAGYEATPAEEMGEEPSERPKRTIAPPQARQAPETSQNAPDAEAIDALLGWAYDAHGLSGDQVLEVLNISAARLARMTTDECERARTKIILTLTGSGNQEEQP